MRRSVFKLRFYYWNGACLFYILFFNILFRAFPILLVFFKSTPRRLRILRLVDRWSETGSRIYVYLGDPVVGCRRCEERNHPREEEAFQKCWVDSSDLSQDGHWTRLNSSESFEQVSPLAWSRLWNFSIETQYGDHIPATSPSLFSYESDLVLKMIKEDDAYIKKHLSKLSFSFFKFYFYY